MSSLCKVRNGPLHRVDGVDVGGGLVAVESVDSDLRVVVWTSSSDVSERVRRAVRALGGDLTIVDECPEPAAFDQGAEVFVVDHALPDWLAVVARVVEECPQLRPLLIGDVDGPDEFLCALSAGVVGFCPKDVSVGAIERSIRSILDAGVSIPRSYTKSLVDAVTHGRGHVVHTAAGDITVTDREWEILQLLVQRRSTREIAETLFVSVGTVRSHVSTLVRKLGAADREDVIALVEHGPGTSSP